MAATDKNTIFKYDCFLSPKQYNKIKKIRKEMPDLTIDIVNQDGLYWIVSVSLSESLTKEEIHKYIAVLLNAALTTEI